MKAPYQYTKNRVSSKIEIDRPKIKRNGPQLAHELTHGVSNFCNANIIVSRFDTPRLAGPSSQRRQLRVNLKCISLFFRTWLGVLMCTRRCFAKLFASLEWSYLASNFGRAPFPMHKRARSPSVVHWSIIAEPSDQYWPINAMLCCDWNKLKPQPKRYVVLCVWIVLCVLFIGVRLVLFIATDVCAVLRCLVLLCLRVVLCSDEMHNY